MDLGRPKDYMYNRWIGPRRATSAQRSLCNVYQVKYGGREWTGRFVSQAQAESREKGGGGGGVRAS